MFHLAKQKDIQQLNGDLDDISLDDENGESELEELNKEAVV